MKRGMAEELTGDLGVSIGELTVDDDLIHLRCVKLAESLVPLAEEVADEPLGALVQGLEVRRELGVDAPTNIKN